MSDKNYDNDSESQENINNTQSDDSNIDETLNDENVDDNSQVEQEDNYSDESYLEENDDIENDNEENSIDTEDTENTSDSDNNEHLAPHELGDTVEYDGVEETGIIHWIKNHVIATSLISLAIVASVVAGTFYGLNHNDVKELAEDVVPAREGYEDNSQNYIANDKIIEGGAKGTITTVDNQQNGTRVSAPWIAIDAQGDSQAATLAPPEDLTKVGWYGRSAWFGQDKGSSVMTSHINYAGKASYGSIFITLRKGDPITITDSKGNVYHYVVENDPFYLNKSNQEEYKKQTQNTINKMNGENKLVLVTCGGAYVGGNLGYEDNVIVSAKLANNDKSGVKAGKDR